MLSCKRFIKFSSFSEAGSALIEFAFVIPIFSLLAFTGYNLMRDMEVHMLRRDLARSINLSYLCSYKQGGAVQVCYEDAVRRIRAYESGKSILNNNNSDESSEFSYSIHTYALKDPTSRAVARVRRNKCPINNSTIANFELNYVGGYTSPNYINPNFDLITVQERAGEDEPIKLTNLFPASLLSTSNGRYARQMTCLNGVITVSEVNFNLKKFFQFGANPTSDQEFYEVSFI